MNGLPHVFVGQVLVVVTAAADDDDDDDDDEDDDDDDDGTPRPPGCRLPFSRRPGNAPAAEYARVLYGAEP